MGRKVGIKLLQPKGQTKHRRVDWTIEGIGPPPILPTDCPQPWAWAWHGDGVVESGPVHLHPSIFPQSDFHFLVRTLACHEWALSLVTALFIFYLLRFI